MLLCCDQIMSIDALFKDFNIWHWFVLKVREEQEKRKLEEEQQGQLPPAQQPGQQSSVEVPQSHPVPQHASYIPPQPNQHSTQMAVLPTSQQSLQSTNYNTPQSTQLTSMTQVVPYVPQSAGQVPAPVYGQIVANIQPESEEPEADQHQHLQRAGGGVYQRWFMVLYIYISLHDDDNNMVWVFSWNEPSRPPFTATHIGDRPGSSEVQPAKPEMSYSTPPSQQLQSQVLCPQTQNDQQQQLAVVSHTE